MRNSLIISALLSIFAEAQKFPPEWSENPSFHSIQEVMPFNDLMKDYYKKCLNDRRCVI